MFARSAMAVRQLKETTSSFVQDVQLQFMNSATESKYPLMMTGCVTFVRISRRKDGLCSVRYAVVEEAS